MFWLFLGKSALKKSAAGKMTSRILLAISLLMLMLGGLGCVALITNMTPGVGDVIKGVVQQVAAPPASSPVK